MQTHTRLLVLALIIAMPFAGSAQVKFYQHDSTVKVYAYGYEQTLAWCGGFNNPQITMGDINNDSLQDIVVFEPWNSVRTFLNMGTPGHPNYRYAPDYALNFPAAYDYLILADYNRDGIPDMWHQGEFGVSVYRGYYNSANQLCFTFYQNLFYNNDAHAGGPANAFNNPSDIPAVVDVDNDGDLDIISFDIGGYTMNLYQNMQVEMGLPADSIHIDLKSRCWGKVLQAYIRTHELAYECDESGLHRESGGSSRTTHSGNTPCLFDWDMDGDYDYLDGSVSYNEMTFLENGRIPDNPTGPDSMVSQDTMWQSQAGGKQVEISEWPAAFNIDVDQDGKKDLLISPNLKGENYNTIWYYKNYSTPGVPDWRFQSDSFMTDMTIDIGTGSYPTYFDYDKDGKPDLFVGSDGYFQTATGQLRSRISYYKNTSTPGHPSFTLQTNDFLGLNAINFQGLAPAIGDIDNDGKADLIVGHSDGTLSYFKNMAASDSVAPRWELEDITLKDMNDSPINVVGYAAPFIYDIDRDGKKDLIIGNLFGTLQYYQNVSTTPGVIKLKFITTELGNITADSNLTYGNYSAPWIGPIDSTGTDYLLVGAGSGNIYEYTGFQSGDTTATYSMLNADFAFVDSACNQYNNPGTPRGIYSGLRSTVAIGDLNNDGNFYMVTGNNKGGLEMYKNKVYTPIIITHVGVPAVNEHGKVEVFPNPASDKLNIKWSGILQDEVQISFMNMEGQQMFSEAMPGNVDYAGIPVDMLPPGMYVCVLQSGVNRYYSKFTVIR